MAQMPRSPMLCRIGTLGDCLEIARHPERWLAEPKYDGQRIIAEKAGDEVRLWSRGHRLVTKQYPDIVGQLEPIPGSWVVDGELYIPSSHGSDFDLLVKRSNTDDPLLISMYAERHPAAYAVFDILFNHGVDYTQMVLYMRWCKLNDWLECVTDNDIIQSVPRQYVTELMQLDALFSDLVRDGYEGVVVKNSDSLYTPGKRSSEWLKFKKRETADVTCVGATVSDALPFGALVLVKDGRYFGKVGTGFSSHMRVEMLDEMRAKQSVVCSTKLPQEVRNELLLLTEPFPVEVSYMEETASGMPRHPVFVRRRADVPA